MIDELLRQVQKSLAYEKNEPDNKKILLGHPDLHRLLKDMVKFESSSTDEEAHSQKFAAVMAKICLKHFDEVISSRAVFILLELLENEKTKKLVFKHLKAQLKEIEKKSKKNPRDKGLQILLKHLQ